MNNNFDIKCDMAIVSKGGFFCEGCLTGKPMDDQSPDPRYCQSCYEFLFKEAEMLTDHVKASWIPKKPQKITAEKISHIPQHGGEIFAHINGKKIHTCKKYLDGKEEKVKTTGRPTLELPIETVNNLYAQGVGVTQIMRELKKQGIKVSRRTVYNVLDGQRELV